MAAWRFLFDSSYSFSCTVWAKRGLAVQCELNKAISLCMCMSDGSSGRKVSSIASTINAYLSSRATQRMSGKQRRIPKDESFVTLQSDRRLQLAKVAITDLENKITCES